MNLIDRLGGYEAARSLKMSQIGLKKHYDEVRVALLEYRRQHNIFQDNDYIVSLHDHEPSHLYTVKNITEEGYDYGNDWGWYGVLSNMGIGYNFRHATDEEIESGRRL